MSEKFKKFDSEKRQNRIARMTADLVLDTLDKLGHDQRVRQIYLDGLRDGFCLSRAPNKRLVEIFGERISNLQGKPFWVAEE